MWCMDVENKLYLSHRQVPETQSSCRRIYRLIFIIFLHSAIVFHFSFLFFDNVFYSFCIKFRKIVLHTIRFNITIRVRSLMRRTDIKK